jgi:hypothetical protein
MQEGAFILASGGRGSCVQHLRLAIRDPLGESDDDPEVIHTLYMVLMALPYLSNLSSFDVRAWHHGKLVARGISSLRFAPHLIWLTTNLANGDDLTGFFQNHKELESLDLCGGETSNPNVSANPSSFIPVRPCSLPKLHTLQFGSVHHAPIIEGNPVSRLQIRQFIPHTARDLVKSLHLSSAPITHLDISLHPQLRQPSMEMYTDVIAQLRSIRFLKTTHISFPTSEIIQIALATLEDLEDLEEFEWRGYHLTEEADQASMSTRFKAGRAFRKFTLSWFVVETCITKTAIFERSSPDEKWSVWVQNITKPE